MEEGISFNTRTSQIKEFHSERQSGFLPVKIAKFPKSDFWNFWRIFRPEITLSQFREIGFSSKIHEKAV
jgi:hypothetical protein